MSPATEHLSAASSLPPRRRDAAGQADRFSRAPAPWGAVTPFIVRCVERQLALGARRDHAIVLGKGDNFRYFSRLNEQHGWFGTLHPLDHPRPIMQYRRKRLAEYVAQYADTFRAAGRARANRSL